MKIPILTTVVALSLATSLSLAQQGLQLKPPPETAAKTEPAQTEPAAPTSPMISAMQQRLEEMQSFWDKMSQTTDPAERQKLMQEHRQKMQELAGMMRGLRGGMTGGPG